MTGLAQGSLQGLGAAEMLKSEAQEQVRGGLSIGGGGVRGGAAAW